MPLYEHTSGECKRTVPGSYEDKRIAANAGWKRVPAEAPAEAPAEVPAEAPADEPAAPQRRGARTTN